MVFPATYAYWRVGPAAAGMSVTDLLAMLGTVAALPYVPWQSPAFKRALLATGMYAVMLGGRRHRAPHQGDDRRDRAPLHPGHGRHLHRRRARAGSGAPDSPCA